MAGYELISSSDLFYNQDRIDIDSDCTMTGTIAFIPRKHASWQTVSFFQLSDDKWVTMKCVCVLIVFGAYNVQFLCEICTTWSKKEIQADS